MKFYSLEPDSYNRSEYFVGINDIYDLCDRYFNFEPHTLLHIGALSNVLKAEAFDGCKTLSIGINVFKDIMWTRLNNLKLTVVDFDAEFVEACNQFAEKEYGISYLCLDVNDSMFDELLRGERFELLILSQMDTLFSDNELRSLINRAFQAQIDYILISSPSLHSIVTSYHPLVICRNLIDLLLDTFVSLRSLRYLRYKNIYYRRVYSSFNKLFRDLYGLRRKEIYDYPSGRMHLLVYGRG